MMTRFFILFLLLVFTGLTYSQTDSTVFDSNLESILEDQTLENENSEFYDKIEYLMQNPIRLNEATLNQLASLPFLNRQAAAAIIRHRNLLGGIYTPEQLLYVNGVNNDVIQKIVPFLELGDGNKLSFFDSIQNQLSNFNVALRTRITQDIQEEKGFADNSFAGSRQKFYNRLIITKDQNIRFGILTEKDAGEKSFGDHTSANLSGRDLGIIESFVLGDYTYEFGQGLALWSSYGVSKGSDAVSVLPKKSNGIRPFLSSEENLFFRGAALSLVYEGIKFNTFFSLKKLDASIDEYTGNLTSFVYDGLHRTPNEVRKKDAVEETLIGISAAYSIAEMASVSFLFSSMMYDRVISSETAVYGKNNSINYFSSAYTITLGKLYFSGEASLNNSAVSTINNIEFLVNRNFSLLFSLRNYSEKYWSLHAASFGERSSARNENGFYSGLKVRSIIGTFDFYYDQYEFPIADQRYKFAAKGSDFLFHYSFKPFKPTEVRVRYKKENKNDLAVIGGELGFADQKYEGIRGELIYKVTKNFQLRSRAEYVSVITSNFDEENGFLFYQDVKFSPIENLEAAARLVLFNTDSYNSRVYQFENDIKGVMTNPPLYGEGSRWYLFISYKTDFGFNFSMKYSELVKPSERTLGSGSSLINGNLDNRISFQLDYIL